MDGGWKFYDASGAILVKGKFVGPLDGGSESDVFLASQMLGIDGGSP